MKFYSIVEWVRRALTSDVVQIDVPTICDSSQSKQNVIDAVSIFLEQTIKHK